MKKFVIVSVLALGLAAWPQSQADANFRISFGASFHFGFEFKGCGFCIVPCNPCPPPCNYGYFGSPVVGGYDSHAAAPQATQPQATGHAEARANVPFANGYQPVSYSQAPAYYAPQTSYYTPSYYGYANGYTAPSYWYGY